MARTVDPTEEGAQVPSTQTPVGTDLARRADDRPEWTTVVSGAVASTRQLPSVGRVVGRFVVANLVAVVLLLGASLWASREAAEEESTDDARTTTDTVASLLVEPHLRRTIGTDTVAARLVGATLQDASFADPAYRDARAALDEGLRELPSIGVVRVKIWTADGTIVYSDEPQLIGDSPGLGADEREALENGTTQAEVSDLTRAENKYEVRFGRLLEVYRPVATADGEPLLLEMYLPYKEATARQKDIWFRFAPISISVLLVLLAMQLPLAGRMVAQLRATQHERELLQKHALDASIEERRRIAGSLHDGIVQDVSAASLLVSGAADQVRDGTPVRESVAGSLREAGTALRQSVAALRSLLVEIYPPDLERLDLPLALADLTARLRPRGIDVRVEAAPDLTLPPQTASVVFRAAREALRNVVKHSGAGSVVLRIERFDDRVLLLVEDDGAGFDVEATLNRPRDGHVGLSVVSDLVAAAGGTLQVRSAPGAGTALALEVPLP
jgi:signal transduction histidine kinase